MPSTKNVTAENAVTPIKSAKDVSIVSNEDNRTESTAISAIRSPKKKQVRRTK
jgi:hypothetical protein